MDRVPPAGRPPPEKHAAAPTAELLGETIRRLEDVRRRAGAGDIADRLATVCDRLRSAQAALSSDRENAVPARDAAPPNETERY